VTRIAVVTGSSRGIGRAVALTLARQGARVVVNYRRDAEAAAATLAGIREAGGDGIVCRADVERPEELTALFAAARQAYGRVDCFVANAAAGPVKPVRALEQRHLARSHATNSQSFVLGAQLARELMGPGGRIVAVSSLAATRAIPGYAAIGAEKAAVEAWVRFLAAEFAPDGINVNAVTGGMIATDSLDQYLAAAGLSPQAVIRHIPKQRPGTPQEVAEVVAFLLSPAAEYLTGQTLVVDGGLSITAPFCDHPTG
jgi:enoyl-[acyl-carrier protein] reductase III